MSVKEKIALAAKTINMARQYIEAASDFINAANADASAAVGSSESARLRKKRKALQHELSQWRQSTNEL